MRLYRDRADYTGWPPIGAARAWLGGLPPAAAHRVASSNGAALFGLR